MCFGRQCALACLQRAACLPTPDPYAELLIGLWSEREREREREEREAEGESDRDPEGGEITPRRSRCTRREGRVPRRRRRWRRKDSEKGQGERQIKEIGASLTELNTDQQHQILLFIQTLLLCM